MKTDFFNYPLVQSVYDRYSARNLVQKQSCTCSLECVTTLKDKLHSASRQILT